jgi:hypothetical protein
VAVFSALVASSTAACTGVAVGEDPDFDKLFFPSGMLLDPRAAQGEAARYLFVVNGNNDLAYNGGSLVAVDLEKFFAAWSVPGTYALDPFCDEAEGRCVLDVGSDIDVSRQDGEYSGLPCRRLALLPQVVECTEAPFIASAQRIGDFATLLTHSCEDEGKAANAVGCAAPRLWVPTRGDPSITYLDLEGAADEVPRFECGAADFDEDCSSEHRLRHLRNDDELLELPREPFNMLVSPTTRLAYVSHSDGTALSLVDLDGIDDGSPDATRQRPALIEAAGLFLDPAGTTGGFGLAERPCSPDDSPPAITLGCTRPLVYAGFRYSRLLATFTVQGVTFDDPAEAEEKCAGVGELDEPGKIPCDERVRSQQFIFPGGLDPSSTGFRPILGDIRFVDDGDSLLVLQTGPGALLKMDTHVGTDGETLDTPSAPPLELCDEPSRMELYEDAGETYALVSCYRAALIYVVELSSFRVLDTIVTGTGAYDVEVDDARDLLYLANNLEGSITVVDLSRSRPTRFREIARIGLQEPFSR